MNSVIRTHKRKGNHDGNDNGNTQPNIDTQLEHGRRDGICERIQFTATMETG